MSSIFTKILHQEIPAPILYQTDTLFVIQDIAPQAKIHLLIIPKEEIASINDLSLEKSLIMGEMFLVAKIMAEKYEVLHGYQLKLNVGEYQEVPHIHMHLLSDK